VNLFPRLGRPDDEVALRPNPDGAGVLVFRYEVSADRVGTDEVGGVARTAKKEGVNQNTDGEEKREQNAPEDGVAGGQRLVVDTEVTFADLRLDA
jgi:hypothetical protein